MVCPFCLHKKSEVYNSRSTAAGVIWRRRRCLNCGKAFTTEESFDPTGIWKVKKGKKITPYDRPKLIMSLLKACDHRSGTDQKVWYLFEIIEQHLLPLAAPTQQITSSQIAAATSTVLKRFDPTAYVKYISYHQPAMDAATLRKRLRRS